MSQQESNTTAAALAELLGTVELTEVKTFLSDMFHAYITTPNYTELGAQECSNAVSTYQELMKFFNAVEKI